MEMNFQASSGAWILILNNLNSELHWSHWWPAGFGSFFINMRSGLHAWRCERTLENCRWPSNIAAIWLKTFVVYVNRCRSMDFSISIKQVFTINLLVASINVQILEISKLKVRRSPRHILCNAMDIPSNWCCSKLPVVGQEMRGSL